MKAENLIYIKLEYSEALKSKKDILSTQIGLLKIAKIIKMHRSLRIEELRLKQMIHKKLKDLIASINKIEELLPKVKMPHILKEYEEDEKTDLEIREGMYDEELETQLRDIQDQLNDLSK